MVEIPGGSDDLGDLGQCEVQGVDVVLQPVGIIDAAFGLRPLLLLDPLEDLFFQPADAVSQQVLVNSNFALVHTWGVPRFIQSSLNVKKKHC